MEFIIHGHVADRCQLRNGTLRVATNPGNENKSSAHTLTRTHTRVWEYVRGRKIKITINAETEAPQTNNNIKNRICVVLFKKKNEKKKSNGMECSKRSEQNRNETQNRE